MDSLNWDARVQLHELNAKKQRLDADLMVSGGILAIVHAILLTELLSVNEDANTFLVLGGLGLTMAVAWLAVAKRAGAREMHWVRKARKIEEAILAVPDLFRVWDEPSKEGRPAWLAMAAVQIAFVIVWFGLMAYAYWTTYL